MKTIIFGHPNRGSFNGAVLDALIAGLSAAGEKYHLIDLYADGFNPVMPLDDLKAYSKGETGDPLVKKYIEALRASDSLAFIFPVWWSDAPAIVKGFLDKAFLPEFAFTEGKTGLNGRLSHIGRVDVFTTATSPKWYLRLICGNPFKKIFLNTVMKSVGIGKGVWRHCRVDRESDGEKRKDYLKSIEKRFSKK
ncbi:MAG: NAD(P)H-dependent oxidoreductase [Helicobacteraceae bacterium]|jgi:putative NADPH-quinone reductase|nr:NAD(P)H-dependent oxidoreductase [Helicobacteraceae bacterium]